MLNIIVCQSVERLGVIVVFVVIVIVVCVVVIVVAVILLVFFLDCLNLYDFYHTITAKIRLQCIIW